MTQSLQIAAVAAVVIVGGLTALKLAANSFDKRYPARGETTTPD